MKVAACIHLPKEGDLKAILKHYLIALPHYMHDRGL